MTKILVVDDDIPLSDQVAESLRERGYLADLARTGSEAQAYLSAAQYDLIVLDWELPDTTGVDLCQQIRSSPTSDVPIIFLTARAQIADKESGFASGADDYLTKPFHMSELTARIKALLRRPPQLQERTIKARDVTLDLAKHEAFKDGIKIDLFPKEYALLEFLVSHPNQIFSADALLRRIWSTDSESSPETVRVTIMRIRQKLNHQDRPLIVTLRNIGYRLEP